MSERPISNMPIEEFDAIIDAFIERETKDAGEIDAPLFNEALRKMVAADTAAEEIEVEGTIVNKQLVLSVPLDIDDELVLRPKSPHHVSEAAGAIL